MNSDDIPSWAIELIKQVERLNEKIPSHVEWATRNILDLEKRMRALEQFKWVLVGVALASGGVGAMIANTLGA